MDDVRSLAGQYLRAAWRRRWLGVVVAWLVCGVGWVGVHMIPNEFESSARVFVGTDIMPTPLPGNAAIDPARTTRREILQRTVLSRPILEKVISRTGLDLTRNSPTDRERLRERLASAIGVTSQGKDLFTVTYRDPNPKLAHDVLQSLLTISVEEAATRSNQLDKENARRSLETQIASYEQQLRAAEKLRADFRAHYIDILPSTSSPGVPALELARTNAVRLDGKLQTAIIARDALKQELASMPTMLEVDLPRQEAANAVMLQTPAASPLQQAEEKLRLLMLKDTEDHPDVIAQKKLIATLKRQQHPATVKAGQVGAAISRIPQSRKRTVPNPLYSPLKAQLTEADTQVVALQRQRDDALAYRDKLQTIQHEQPGLIAEYENMDRYYSVLRKNYEELLVRLQAANIAQASDTQADTTKLRIVDPPSTPNLPVAPNRTLLVTVVFFAGMGAGLGAAFVFARFDHSFSTPNDLRILGLPVLGGISVLGLASVPQKAGVVTRFTVAVVVLIGVYGGLIVHILRPAALI